MTTAINIQALDKSAVEWIENEVQRLGLSAETIITRLIHKEIRAGNNILNLKTYNDLDELAGTWDEDDLAEFADAAKEFNQGDPELWK